MLYIFHRPREGGRLKLFDKEYLPVHESKPDPKDMRFFLAFFSAMSVPIGFLNIFGGIVSGIWLAFLGQWRPIDIGLLSLFCTTWLIGFALMPGRLFAAPAAIAFERAHRFTDVVFGALAKLYTTAVIVTWSYQLSGAPFLRPQPVDNI
jgi:hypothetical protein